MISFRDSVAAAKDSLLHLVACKEGPGNCDTCDKHVGFLLKNWLVAMALGAGALLYFYGNRKRLEEHLKTGKKEKKK